MVTAHGVGRDEPALPGRCECRGQSLAVVITHLTGEGCVLLADAAWRGAADFLHLHIAGSIAINGRLVWADGHRARMRFFGQIHPAAIAKLMAVDASCRG